MKKQVQRMAYIVFIGIVTMSVMSCGGVLDRVKGLGKSEQPEPKKTEPKKTEPKKPDVQNIIKQGIAHREAGNLKKAMASFEQALGTDPKNAEAAQYLQETQNELDALIESYLKQGIKYFTDDALQEAMAEWNKVLELDPSNAKALDYKERTQNKLDALK